MRVAVTEKSLRDAGYNLTEGDTITVPDEVGKVWCKHGWAKDTEGKVPTGKRIVRGEQLDVQSGTLASTDTEG